MLNNLKIKICQIGVMSKSKEPLGHSHKLISGTNRSKDLDKQSPEVFLNDQI